MRSKEEVLCSRQFRSVFEAMWVGLQGWYRWKYRHDLVFFAASRIRSVGNVRRGAACWGDRKPLGGIAMLEPIICLGLVCLVAGQSRKSDAKSEGPDGSRTDLGFDADPILIAFSMLSADMDLLYIGHLKSKSLYQTFSRGAGFIHGYRVEPTPDGHFCTSIADLHNTAESLIR